MKVTGDPFLLRAKQKDTEPKRRSNAKPRPKQAERGTFRDPEFVCALDDESRKKASG